MILSDELCFELLKNCDLRAIAAVSQNGIIGKNNKIPWHIPEELKFFRDTTSGTSVLMGRKTFQSIGKLLPNRQNIILSRSGFAVEGALVTHSVEEILNIKGTIWICGGASVYKLLLPVCRELYLSTILKPYDGDTFFPNYQSIFSPVEIIFKHPEFRVTKLINKKLL